MIRDPLLFVIKVFIGRSAFIFGATIFLYRRTLAYHQKLTTIKAECGKVILSAYKIFALNCVHRKILILLGSTNPDPAYSPSPILTFPIGEQGISKRPEVLTTINDRNKQGCVNFKGDI